jgi:anti-sigma regulatory factor (Ser/Thr protein kinase)
VAAPWNKALAADPIAGCERPPRPASGEATCSQRLLLPAAGHAAKLARRATHVVLLSWRLAHLEETAELLVSELVTNAVQHTRMGSSVIMLRLEIGQNTLRIEVTDADPRRPQPRQPVGLDESGFGFVLIEALAREWGTRNTAAGKAVWADLDTRSCA